MRFDKMHGLGNDFILVDARELPERDWPALARRLCRRRFAIGADGIILVLASETCDWRMRVLNSDGSEAQMCGNGIRCFAKFLVDRHLESRSRFTIETLAGVMVPELIENDGASARVAVDMGAPKLAPEAIPFVADEGAEQVVGAFLQVDDDPMSVTCLSMGNPHCVLFVNDLERMQVEWWGPMIERHERFPQRTNVEFVQVHSAGELSMRVWERGAGRTLACGTGACAALVAACLNGLTDREATVHLEGGDLRIVWGDDDHVTMTGPAETAYAGEVEP